jgi:SAM-dependent methyltransferase
LHEILRNLPSGARVLDLGSRSGSFDSDCCPVCLIVRLDREPPERRGGNPIQGDATHLPFADHTFDAVIANHSLEHMDALAVVLKEISRVVRRHGSFYVAVPDASTFTDRLYRWIYHGGGHVNAFRSAGELSRLIAATTGLPCVATRVLHTSLSFLHRAHFHPRPPRRLWLLANGNPRFIAALTYGLRIVDRLFPTRFSVYGWAFYFGNVPEQIETTPWTNVCIECGAGHSVSSLIVNDRVRRHLFGFKSYHCPDCGAWNPFTKV